MKAVIFALIVLLGVDVVAFESLHVRSLRASFVAGVGEIGEWVYHR